MLVGSSMLKVMGVLEVRPGGRWIVGWPLVVAEGLVERRGLQALVQQVILKGGG